MKYIFVAAMALMTGSSLAQSLTSYVDPRIGSEGLGRVCIGPSAPFGMVKPSPDCTSAPNSGWLPMPERVDGFSQVHVSGTGGGPKYGNILVMPFCSGLDRTTHIDYRQTEDIALAYYATTFAQSGIRTEITTAERASYYRFTYPADSLRSLSIDAGFFLGEQPTPDAREAQQLVGSEVEILSDHELQGYSRVRGGWNNGRAYTVYFYAETDTPFTLFRTWKDGTVSHLASQYDSGQKTGANVQFEGDGREVNLRVGISFVSALKARQNAHSQITGWSLEGVRERTLDAWQRLLERVKVDPSTPDAYKRMLYTGLYHTMLMPVDRTGECPLWNDPSPYYDDYYAIWDTYRTSSPLLTLIDPQRQADLIRSLLLIYKREGYMPDARSGNSNGRTQGGSNAEIMIADAFAKGLEGIDYEYALQAMLQDGEVPPGGNEEAEGRGGLLPYLTLGYVPWGIPRAGNRTVEYAFCDWAIAQVAKGLGHDSIAAEYQRRSQNWKNLWRADYEQDGARGFILPRDAEGRWLDELPFGHSRQQQPTYRYTPVTAEGPWYTPWWSTFFYEASSWEYSLSIPHDVPGLIDACGGAEAFERRLDRFFDGGYYNVNNEPSFLTPCLYHWIGRPDRSSDRVRQIIARHYSDAPAGLPGNDDSGAMSSWLVFHMMGLYPNAGTDYYLIHTPLLASTTLTLAHDRTFTIQADGLSERNRYIQSATLNGQRCDASFLTHRQLMEGGVLRLKMGAKPVSVETKTYPVGTKTYPIETKTIPVGTPGLGVRHPDGSNPNENPIPDENHGISNETIFRIIYKLHGQTRRYTAQLRWLDGDSLRLNWTILRNGEWQSGSYTLTPEARRHATQLSYAQPIHGQHLTLTDATFALLSQDALRALHADSLCLFNHTEYRLQRAETEPTTGRQLLHLIDRKEGAQLTVWDNPQLPLILQMQDNPVEINWQIESGWTVESESPQYQVSLQGDTLEIVSPKGLTLWRTEKNTGDVTIDYDACVMTSRPDDRLSDLNCFLLARDPQHPADLMARAPWRSGIFMRCYTLELYYLGYGGNYNSTTRFRRYNGDERGVDQADRRPPVLVEYTDAAHLLRPDHWYHIHIERRGARVQYYVDGELLVDYTDADPIPEGWFGFRTTLSRVRITGYQAR
jgi:predicted alpha-1,2-mannosidase